MLDHEVLYPYRFCPSELERVLHREFYLSFPSPVRVRSGGAPMRFTPRGFSPQSFMIVQGGIGVNKAGGCPRGDGDRDSLLGPGIERHSGKALQLLDRPLLGGTGIGHE